MTVMYASRDCRSAIGDLVDRAMETGLLSLADECQLRALMATSYTLEDFRAIVTLQYAAETGQVLQESRRVLDLARADADIRAEG